MTTTEQRQQRKEERRKAQVPAPRTYNVRLPNGTNQKVKATFGVNKVTLSTELFGKSAGKAGPPARKITCTFEFRPALIERRVKVFGQVVKKNGKPLLVSVPLPATYAYLTVNGEKFTALSYCKPPDVFSRQTGAKFALRRALRQASHLLEDGDFEALVRVCLTKPPKPGQIRHSEKLAKLNSATGKQTPHGLTHGEHSSGVALPKV